MMTVGSSNTKPTARPRRIVVGTTVLGTIRSLVMPQVPALQQAGWDVHLVASEPWTPPAGSGLTYHSIAMHRAVTPARDARSLTDWVRLLRHLQPDVVLGSTPKAGLLSMLSARWARVGRRVLLHRGARWETMSGPNRRLLMKLDAMSMSSATDVLAVSDSLADLLVSEGVTKVRPTVLGAGGSKGVDLTRFIPGVDRSPREDPVVGFAGRLAGDKGLTSLLMAFDSARARFPRARLRIAGEWDMADRAHRQLRTKMVSDPSIDLLGHVSDMPRFFQSIDVLAFPSNREGLPNAVIEAAACGVPTVAWDVTGVRDAVQHGVTGLLVEKGDQRALGDAIVEALIQPNRFDPDACVSWAGQFDERRMTQLLLAHLANPPGRPSDARRVQTTVAPDATPGTRR